MLEYRIFCFHTVKDTCSSSIHWNLSTHLYMLMLCIKLYAAQSLLRYWESFIQETCHFCATWRFIPVLARTQLWSLSWRIRIQGISSPNLFQINFNTILPPSLRSSEFILPIRAFNQNSANTSHKSSARYMVDPYHPLYFTILIICGERY